MSSTALEIMKPVAVSFVEAAPGRLLQESLPARILPVPWRDPHTVSKKELAVHIGNLEKACAEQPQSADLRTCLGMAYAMDYRVYQSMDALEAAAKLDETHFFAQIKVAELYYRLRALPRAEQETLRAMNLAQNAWELGMSRKLLQEIRRLIRDGTQKPEWNKSLKTPAIIFMVTTVALCAAVWLVR